MEVGQGPNWGCSAKEKKYIKLVDIVTPNLHETEIKFLIRLFKNYASYKVLVIIN
jgi:hypothetical protein